MGTRFLLGFARATVDQLERHGQLEMVSDGRERVVAYLAEQLEGLGTGHSLISSVSAALLACPDVVELYADDDEIKRLITELGQA